MPQWKKHSNCLKIVLRLATSNFQVQRVTLLIGNPFLRTETFCCCLKPFRKIIFNGVVINLMKVLGFVIADYYLRISTFVDKLKTCFEVLISFWFWNWRNRYDTYRPKGYNIFRYMAKFHHRCLSMVSCYA